MVRNPAGTFMPPRMRTTLCFSANTAINNVGASTANIRYTPTFVYDIDPTLGSTSAPGFTELVGLYRFYRTDSAKVEVNFANNDAFPSAVAICPSNTDPGATGAAATVRSYFSNPLSRHRICGPLTGANTCFVRASASTAQFGGVAWTGQIDSYSATGSTAPSNNWYFFIGLETNGTLVNGIFVDVKITIVVDFFEYANPSA